MESPVTDGSHIFLHDNFHDLIRFLRPRASICSRCTIGPRICNCKVLHRPFAEDMKNIGLSSRQFNGFAINCIDDIPGLLKIGFYIIVLTIRRDDLRIKLGSRPRDYALRISRICRHGRCGEQAHQQAQRRQACQKSFLHAVFLLLAVCSVIIVRNPFRTLPHPGREHCVYQGSRFMSIRLLPAHEQLLGLQHPVVGLLHQQGHILPEVLPRRQI